jgi:hypothetical protein
MPGAEPTGVVDSPEQQPLLPPQVPPTPLDVARIRQGARPTVEAHRLLHESTYISKNIPWIMFTNTLVQVIIFSFGLNGSLWVLVRHYDLLTPLCYELYPTSSFTHVLHRRTCYTSNFCLWTFPALSAWVVILTLWRYLYESRLFYECLLHRILINYRNGRAMLHPLAHFYACYALVALTSAYYAPAPGALMGFLAPAVSFMFGFISWLQVEDHLISLPKFYETDPEEVRRVMADAVFADEHHLHVSFEIVEEALAGGSAPSAEYFALLAEAVRKEAQFVRGRSAELAGAQGGAQGSTWYDPLLARIDLVRMREQVVRDDALSRPEVISCCYSLRKGSGFWWISRLLHSEHLKDDRSDSFRGWVTAFGVVAIVGLLFWTELFVGFAKDLLRRQKLML